MHEDLEMPKLGPTKQDDPKWTPTPWVVNSHQQRIEGCDYVIVEISKRSLLQPVDYHNLRRIRDCVNGLAHDGNVAKLVDRSWELYDFSGINDPEFERLHGAVRASVGKRPA